MPSGPATRVRLGALPALGWSDARCSQVIIATSLHSGEPRQVFVGRIHCTGRRPSAVGNGPEPTRAAPLPCAQRQGVMAASVPCQVARCAEKHVGSVCLSDASPRRPPHSRHVPPALPTAKRVARRSGLVHGPSRPRRERGHGIAAASIMADS